VLPFANAPDGVGPVALPAVVDGVAPAKPLLAVVLPVVLPVVPATPGVSVSVGGVLPTDVPEFVELELLSFAALDFEVLGDGAEAT
jgi:hypothetical protein